MPYAGIYQAYATYMPRREHENTKKRAPPSGTARLCPCTARLHARGNYDEASKYFAVTGRGTPHHTNRYVLLDLVDVHCAKKTHSVGELVRSVKDSRCWSEVCWSELVRCWSEHYCGSSKAASPSGFPIKIALGAGSGFIKFAGVLKTWKCMASCGEPIRGDILRDTI